MCVLHQFCQGNVLLVQGGLFVLTLNKPISDYTSLTINLIQFAAIIFGIVYLHL